MSAHEDSSPSRSGPSPPTQDRTALDSLVTILVPTRNRPVFLARLLALFAQEELQSALVVADSSDVEAAEGNSRTLESYQDRLRIKSLRFGVDEGPGEKIFGALQHVETPYTVYAGDDDLLIPSGLRACLRALQGHPDWVGARGRIFELLLSEPYGWPEAGHEWPRDAGPQDRATDRLSALLPCFWQTCQSVLRTEVFRGGFTTIFDSAVKPLFAEVLQCAYPLTVGKIGIVDDLYYIHQSHQRNLAKEQSFNDVLAWLARPTWAEEYLSMRRHLIPPVAAADGLPEQEVAAALEVGILETIRGWIDSDLHFRMGSPPPPPPPQPGPLWRLLRWGYHRLAPGHHRRRRDARIFGRELAESAALGELRRFMGRPPSAA